MYDRCILADWEKDVFGNLVPFMSKTIICHRESKGLNWQACNKEASGA